MHPIRMILAVGAMCALTIRSAAQSPLNAGTAQFGSAMAAAVGGTSTIDLIHLSQGTPGVPLRHGGVISGSDRVDLDGRRLVRGVDYQIDLASGVVYLLQPYRAGQALTVAYRHDPAKAAKQGSQNFGLGMVKLDFVPQGGMSMLLGMGMTERQADGNVLTSNIFGLNNSFSFGQANLKGIFLSGQRQRAAANSIFEFAQPGAPQDLGKSSLILQSFSAKVGGGTVSANYQDVSNNFTAFDAARGAGFEESVVEQLRKEKGLSRTSLDIKDLGSGAFKFSSAYKTIGEGDNSIDWRSFAFGLGGISAFYNSQDVGAGFTRFKDLMEGDRGQLEREKGMSRENYGLGFAQGSTRLNFTSSNIADPANKGINLRTFDFNSTGVSLKAGQQSVAQGFSRIDSLPDSEKNRLAREVGTKRNWLDLSWMAAKGGPPLKFAQSTLQSQTGEFKSTDLSFGGRNWGFEHISRNAGEGFNGFSSMQDSERAANLRAITSMYQLGGFDPKPEEMNRFMQLSGIERDLTRLRIGPTRGWNFLADHFKIEGAGQGATVDAMKLTSTAFNLAFRRQSMDDGFSLLPSLMEFERERLGTIQGLDRMDFSAALKLGGSRSLGWSRMNASAPEGDASRQSVNYRDTNLEMSLNQRNVDMGFTGAGQLVDPEKDLLMSLRGFSQRDLRIKWQFLPGLTLDGYSMDANSGDLDQTRFNRNLALNWTPDKETTISLLRMQRRDDDPFQLLFGNSVDLMNFTRNFGRMGSLRYLHESQNFMGKSELPDSDKQTIAYETKLSQKTSFKTEQTRTRFDNGDKEDVNAHTLSTEVGRGAGVSLSQVNVDRGGEDRDEKKRLYGFWVDIGGGLRLSYGMNEHRAPDAANNTQGQQANLGTGNLGNLAFGQANYNQQYLEGAGTKTGTNVQVSTRKPFSLGFFKELQIFALVNKNSDHSRWLQDNQVYKLLGKFGTNSFALEYKGQIHSSGNRAIDRAFEFVTDQKETNPLRASIKYKVRTMPWDEQIMIRDYSIFWKPTKDFEVTNQLITNPTLDRADALLGSVVQAKALNRWKLDYKSSGSVRVGGQWEEIIDVNQPRLRTAGVNITLNANNPSPLYLYYGLEQSDRADGRRTTNRYHLRFDQRAGPNQMFSIFMGNVSYQHSIIDGKKNGNWTIRLDYQLRF